MKIGVLALQGAFAEHLAVLHRLGVEGREVRLPRDLHDLAGLIIPGGESTSIGLLAREYGLLQPLRAFGLQHPVWGTCAGAILLGTGGGEPMEERLGLLDVSILRNAFGRQVESFQVPLQVPILKGLEENGGPEGGIPSPPPAAPHEGAPCPSPFPGVFIRAPVIDSVDSPEVEVLARLEDGSIVSVRQGHLLATVFHPELTTDDRFHRLFLTLVE